MEFSALRRTARQAGGLKVDGNGVTRAPLVRTVETQARWGAGSFAGVSYSSMMLMQHSTTVPSVLQIPYSIPGLVSSFFFPCFVVLLKS